MSTTISIHQFDGGMTFNPRDPRTNVARVIEHFDIFTSPNKLTPQYTAELGDSSSAHTIKNFAYDGTSVYGMGDNGSGNIGLFTRTAFANASWATLVSNIGAAFADVNLPFFLYYPKTDKVYGAQGGRYIWSCPSSGAGSSATAADLTAFSVVSNGVVHSKDDILYMGYDNKIAKNNNDSWTVLALTLPSSYYITSLSEYGNYLAIGCRHRSGGNSRVFLWDRDSTVSTLAESIDWGEGNLTLLDQLDGYLIGISFEGTTGSYNLQGRVVGRYYNGSTGTVKFTEFVGSAQGTTEAGQTTVTNQATLFKHKSHNRILFPAIINIRTTSYPGVWSIGRDSGTGLFSVTLEQAYLNQSSFGTLYGISKLGDYLFAVYGISGNATIYMDKTDDTSIYTTTSIYESTVNPSMPPGDRPVNKRLMGVWATYETLPTAGQVVCKYRVDGGSWLTVFTETGDGETNTLLYRRAAAAMFTNGVDYEFRLESTGGAEITSFNYEYKTIP